MGKIIVGLFIFGVIMIFAYDEGIIDNEDLVKAFDYTKDFARDLIIKIKEI